VNLILTTVTNFASLIPQTAGSPTAQKAAVTKVTILYAKDLKKQWNPQVCGPSRNATLDAAFGVCMVK